MKFRKTKGYKKTVEIAAIVVLVVNFCIAVALAETPQQQFHWPLGWTLALWVYLKHQYDWSLYPKKKRSKK